MKRLLELLLVGKLIVKASIAEVLVLLLVFALVEDVAAQAVSFLPRRDFNFRSGPMVVGDFNNDGIQDLYSTHVESIPPLVEVLLGNGDGTFHPVMNSGVAPMPLSVAVGDFNGDGIQDLAMAHDGGGSIQIGNGDGTFQSRQSVAFGRFGRSVAIGDFNKDGFQDLAIVSSGTNLALPGDALIVLGNGDGTFQPAQAFETGIGPTSIAIGDFNGDGLQDLAATNVSESNVAILLGNGDGTFQPAQTFGAGRGPSSVAIGDFNGDGLQDLAVTNRDSNDGSILLGNGNGTFQSARTFGTGESPNSVAIGDFNGDRIQDLAVANSGSDHISILLGNGNGSFHSAENLGTGMGPSSVAIADFNRDGAPDLAVANSISDTVSVFINDFQPMIGLTIAIRPRIDPNRINPNSTGHTRVAILSDNGFDATTVLPNTVRFGATGSEAAPVSFVLRDVNGDGNVDMILRFLIQETDIKCRQTSALLTGETSARQLIQGSDSIKTVRCNN